MLRQTAHSGVPLWPLGTILFWLAAPALFWAPGLSSPPIPPAHRICWVNSASPRDFHTRLRLPDCFLPWTSAVFHTLASTRSRHCRAFRHAFRANNRIQTPSLKPECYHIPGCSRGSSPPRAGPQFTGANFLKNVLLLDCHYQAVLSPRSLKGTA